MPNYLESFTVDSTPDCEVVFPQFVKFPATQPPDPLQNFINHFKLEKHAENGYFKETDRSPFVLELSNQETNDSSKGSSTMPTATQKPVYKGNRNFSTLIYYMLTPDAPVSKLIMNTSRNIHILQRGKGQFVLIYPNGSIKSFKVGFDYSKGEVSQWVVPGGVWKASFMIPNEEFDNGFLISEVVVPGFEYSDYKPFPGFKELVEFVGEEKAELFKPLL
ncbi:LAQU0S22e01156g1_1 [Lachancea quebecensis]|uniref:LAQU0S22e01156g1_1 n=1 Tax=Lachancea quebecensis TaxID=1654605 RepID=A0A0N7MMF5_9SACH|nr:LAQU0S22e01156g1_1 [Lachancea quebecensis]